MKNFFDDRLLLNSTAAEALYTEAKTLPIIDCHCHLDEAAVANDRKFDGIGELWLAADHYKWRAMRLCGVDERFITGDADYYEKFLAYAGVFPQLAGNPLYYWTQLELKLVFGINTPLNEKTAPAIYRKADKVLKKLSVRGLLKRFGVEFLATTDDPTSSLEAHGTYDGIVVSPTFRPDAIFSFDKAYSDRLGAVAGVDIRTLADLKTALLRRLDFFVENGCRIADHGMDFLPDGTVCSDGCAAHLFETYGSLDAEDKSVLFTYLNYWLAERYAERGMVMQLHFGTNRNVNRKMFDAVGRDSGFDVFRSTVDTDRLAGFLDRLNSDGRLPKTLLYSLNPAAVPAVCAISGAFPEVFVGAAWWFNDTVDGIRRQLSCISEYAVLGRSPGMLTDSRSFSGYVRFDFFRRILADYLGNLVENGELDSDAARLCMQKICYNNVKELLGL